MGRASKVTRRNTIKTIPLKPLLKVKFFPHSWENVNPEINCSQMLQLQEFMNAFTLMCSWQYFFSLSVN